MKLAHLLGAGATASAVLLGGATACSGGSSVALPPPPAPTRSVATTAAHAPTSAAPAPRCSAPAPSSAAGYRRMFDNLPAGQWGAADVAISKRLPDGRVLWLFGDTFSAGRFVHSSAIVQDRGCLHVVNAGKQLLPNLDPRHIFWIGSVRVEVGIGITVTARAITLTGRGPWDFRDGGYDQEFTFDLDAAGDVQGGGKGTFGGALANPVGPRLYEPAPDPGPMRIFGPHHFGYAEHRHPEAHLASGRTLVTICQNWDDRQPHALADYRPIFTES